jgi:hypothetical protein
LINWADTCRRRKEGESDLVTTAYDEESRTYRRILEGVSKLQTSE